MDQFEHEHKFYKNLKAFYSKGNNRKPWKRSEMIAAAEDIKSAKKNWERKSRRQYHLLSLYDILEEDNKLVIIKKKKTEKDNVIYITPYEDLYKILYRTHISIGHGCRDKMSFALKNKYQVPRCAIEIFLTTCEVCKRKKNRRHAIIATKTFISKVSCPRGEVNLIDLQTCSDGEYKWLLNYQDYQTKCVFLRPLTSNQPVHVSTELLKIFLEIGTPGILHSDLGNVFIKEIIAELSKMWPAPKILTARQDDPLSSSPESLVTGQMVDPLSQEGMDELINQGVENMIHLWMKDNQSSNWSLGCYFVQFQINQKFQAIVGSTPHKALFGREMKVGLSCSNVPDKFIATLETEEELDNLLKENKSEYDSDSQESDRNLLQIKTEIEDNDDALVLALENSICGDINMQDEYVEDFNIDEVSIKTESLNNLEEDFMITSITT